MKIRRKLLLSYLLIVGLFIAAGATLTWNTIQMSNLQNNMKQEMEISNNAYAYQQGLDQKQFGTLMYASDNVENGSRVIVSAADTMYPAETYLLSALANKPELLAKFNEAADIDKNQINGAITNVYTIYNSNANSSEKYVDIWSQLSVLMTAVDQADLKLAEVRSDALANVQSATVTAQNYANFSTLLAIGFISAISVISVGLAVAMGNRITRPLKKLADIAHKVSLGDLKQRYYLKQDIDIKTGDEIDELVDAFKRMINAFRVTEALSMETAEPEEIVEQ